METEWALAGWWLHHALEFHTFSIVAVDPRTNETGVAVTTRNPCVGNAVPWVRAGATLAVQGNSIVSPEVVYAVAASFQASEGSPRHLADRLIEALDAGQRLGGDGRHGETQSAAVLVADPRPGMSRRPDGQTVNINVCEHPEPVGELRRIYDTASETLGFRTLEQPIGRDVAQLKMMLHALGYFGQKDNEFDVRAPQANVYTQEAVDAVDKFRAAEGWQTTVPGFVDARTIARLWQRLDQQNRANEIRKRMLDLLRVR